MSGRRIYDLFADDEHRRVNPELQRMAREEQSQRRMRGHRPKRGEKRGRPPAVPSRRDVVEALRNRDMLPAIYFVFSRAGCDGAVRQLLQSGVRLTDPQHADEIRDFVEQRTAHLTDEDLRVLDFGDFLDGLERGFAAHHAGLLPVFKEIVEDLFARGLVMCVFATETLALGVNMPARTVVIEKLTKWNGETHAEITPSEYTQLTGRAGRRGIDVEGDAVVLWQPGFDPQALAGLASTRTYPLRSSFSPTYNMAVNLVRQMGRHTAREVLETSFAQFQAARTRKRSLATRRPWSATWGTSPSTRPSVEACRTARSSSPAMTPRADEPRWQRPSRSSSSAMSSASQGAGAAGVGSAS
jgi:ATP-dependent RNA helicase HelY